MATASFPSRAHTAGFVALLVAIAGMFGSPAATQRPRF